MLIQADWRPIGPDQQMFPTPMKDSPPPDENSDPTTELLLQNAHRLNGKQRGSGVLQEIGNSKKNEGCSTPNRYQFRNNISLECSPSRLSPLPCLT